jgi:PAS domain-containing protein
VIRARRWIDVTGPRPWPILKTIPSTDSAFRAHVERMAQRHGPASAADLQARLRRMFPRVLVRERALSSESPTWYVYRDGSWTPPLAGPWWDEPRLPRVVVGSDGWVLEANPAARSLFGIVDQDVGARHFTDFIAPGTLEDAQALFAVVAAGHELTATALVKPTNAQVIATDIHAESRDGVLVGTLRLAEGVDVPGPTRAVEVELVVHPAPDEAFRRYAELLLGRMPEPSPDGLALRLRRLYPHARVEPAGDRWLVFRDETGLVGPADGWWLDLELPRVRYDAQGLILEANAAAERMLGSTLPGHFWQEFVTGGTTEQVSTFLELIRDAGVVVSRFRMPGADGSLVEFDSFTEVAGESFLTVMRPDPS